MAWAQNPPSCAGASGDDGRLGGMLDRQGRMLLTTLAFVGLRPKAGVTATEIETLRRWLDSWPGVGRVAIGMAARATTCN
jgi:hypothetical protein